MAKSNLDKFYEIQDMMDQFLVLESDYLDKLKERSDYMSEYRAEYNRLKRSIHTVKADLEGKQSIRMDKGEKNLLIDSAKRKVNKQIERHEEALEYEMAIGSKKVINVLSDALNTLKKDVTKKQLERINDELIGVKVFIEEIETLILITSKGNVNQKKIENAINLLDMAYNEYLSTFSEYRSACEHKDGMVETFADIHKVLLGLGFESEAAKLKAALPDYDDQKRKRPNADELLDILTPFKSYGLVYWQSNNKNSLAYDHNVKLSESISKTRATLLRKAEFKGTENAFKQLKKDYEGLKDYMEERYYQLGGKPNNFHGHDDRKKK